jgi:glycosyltransferase involved in cell wall biosynthesis
MISDKALRILIYTRGLPISGEDPVEVSSGGSEAAAVSMARALQRLGHSVTISCLTDRARQVGGVDLFPCDDLSSYLADGDCDVFLSSRFHDVLQRPVKANLIGMWHHDMPCKTTLGWLGPALATSDCSLFVSQFQRDAYEQYRKGISRLALLTSNGVDFCALETIARDAPDGRSAPKLIYASRPERGLHFLLDKIWPRIRERHPDAELLVASYAGVADPALKAYEEACAALLRRASGVRVLGNLTRRNLWRTMANCVAVLHPTDFPETSCMVALEAQALGIPVVASDRFALRETVAFKPTLVGEAWGTDAYVGSFVDTTSRLIEDETFAGEAKAAGLRHVCRETHSWDAIAAQWTDYFCGLLSERCRRPRPKISATILVKNEELHLRRCIESIEGVVDEIILGDTGSTDRTLAIAEEMGFQRADGAANPELPPRRVVTIDFENFSQARNAVAQHALGDYIFWQDADEILVNSEQLRKWVDGNVYYDGFSWEQRHAIVDGKAAPDHPVRCFKRNTPNGSPGWFGCIHEVIGYGLNEGLERLFPIPDMYLAHVGYLYEGLRRQKGFGRNFPLLVRDRLDHPDRHLGYLLGMREYLNLAKADLGESGGAMTEKAYRYLNYGFEIWDESIRLFPEPFPHLAHEYLQEVLSVLAQFRLPLRKTGCVPFWAEISLSANYLGTPTTQGRVSALFSSIEDFKRTAETNLRAIEQCMSNAVVSPPIPISVDSSPQWRHLDLAPELFGLTPWQENGCGEADAARGH